MKTWDRLFVAPFAPLADDGELNPGAVEKMAGVLLSRGVQGVYLCGSTGEGVLLTPQERMALVQRWVEVLDGQVPIVVHAGDICIKNACSLAAHAQRLGVDGVSAIGPMYPGVPLKHIDDLLLWSATIAGAAPGLPFFHYHMGAVAGLPRVRMADYATRALDRIPNFTGIKFTHEDLMDFSRCLDMARGRYAVLFGRDEMMLPAMISGARGFVGGTFNLTSPLALSIIKAYRDKNLDLAQLEQRRLQEVVALIQRHGGMPALKAAMSVLGLHLGPLRQPWCGLDSTRTGRLLDELQEVWPDVCRVPAITVPYPDRGGDGQVHIVATGTPAPGQRKITDTTRV